GCSPDDPLRIPALGAQIAAYPINRSPTSHHCDCRRCRPGESESFLAATALRPTSPANRLHPARTWIAGLVRRRRSDSCTFAALPVLRLLRQFFRGLLTLCLPDALRESNCDSP